MEPRTKTFAWGLNFDPCPHWPKNAVPPAPAAALPRSWRCAAVAAATDPHTRASAQPVGLMARESLAQNPVVKWS